MNPWQMAQQIKFELEKVFWGSTSTDLVFGAQGQNVAVFAGTPTEEQLPTSFPFCLVGLGTGTHDEDHPELISQQFDLVTAVNVTGDPMGEHAVIGGSARVLTGSAGRGILEIAERVRSAVQNLLGDDGAKIMLSATSTGAPTTLGRGQHLALDELTLTALCTSGLHYAAPQVFARSGTTWTWEGAHCSDRFDFLTYVVRRATGSIPASPTAGTDVYTGTAATTTHTAVSGDTYVVFAQYNARGGKAAEDNSSSTEVGASLVEA